MLARALCMFPNPFSLLSDDPYEALWRVAALCGVVLGIETIILFWRNGRSPFAFVTLVATVGALALAAIAGRQAMVGLVCAGVPGATAAAAKAAEMSYDMLVVLQWCGIAACLVTLILVVMGLLRLARQPKTS